MGIWVDKGNGLFWVPCEGVLVMDVRLCIGCGAVIPKARLELLPDTRHYIGCSEERRLTELDVEMDGPDLHEVNQSV